jgi:hypothetical protein
MQPAFGCLVFFSFIDDLHAELPRVNANSAIRRNGAAPNAMFDEV